MSDERYDKRIVIEFSSDERIDPSWPESLTEAVARTVAKWAESTVVLSDNSEYASWDCQFLTKDFRLYVEKVDETETED